MFCSSCGGNNPDNSAFCNACGKKLNAPEGGHDLTTASRYATPPVTKTDGKAVASLIFGILSVTILWIVAGIPAIIFGHVSRAAIRRSAGELKGSGMALAGLIMGYLSVAAIPFILIIATISIPSLLRSRQAERESAAVANLRTINTAELSYEYSHKGIYGTIPQLIADGLLFDGYANGQDMGGYTFSVTVSKSDYLATATPTSTAAGRYGYLSTSDAVIRYQRESTNACNPCFPSAFAGSPIL
jgi:hypothetical protein